MNQKNTSSIFASAVNTDAIQALANIYLTSAERMVELNLNTVREVLEESVTVSKEQQGKGVYVSDVSQLNLLKPMVDKAMTYSHSVYAIFVETQQEASKTLMSQVSNLSTSYKVPADWNAPFEIFNKGVQQLSALATQGASATDEVVRKTSESITKASKAA
jgi:hypothetical protein